VGGGKGGWRGGTLDRAGRWGGDRRWEGGGGGGRMEHRGGWSEKVGGRRYDWGGRARTGWMDELGGRKDWGDRQMGGWTRWPEGPGARTE